MEKETAPQPCASCPWLRENQGKRHANQWYTQKNLLRLWNGLRTGKAPGMVCHATDPESVNYGGKGAKEGIKRECVGSLVLVARHLALIEKCRSLPEYQAQFKKPMTKWGLAAWAERIIFRRNPIIIPDPSTIDIGTPWEV